RRVRALRSSGAALAFLLSPASISRTPRALVRAVDLPRIANGEDLPIFLARRDRHAGRHVQRDLDVSAREQIIRPSGQYEVAGRFDLVPWRFVEVQRPD